MQAVHEGGHLVGAWLTGGRVTALVLHPLKISRTELAANPRPLVVVWCGPLIGTVAPLAVWIIAARAGLRAAFVLRFFAGFCLIANGAYIGFGSFGGVGDCGEMLRHGSPPWLLWLFGVFTMPLGIRLWHRQGACFGFGGASQPIQPKVTFQVCVVCLALLIFGFWHG